MTQKPRVLIFTSRTGGGHVSLAESLRDLLESDFAVSVLDPQPALVHNHYRWVSRYALWVWNAEYAISDTPRRALMAQRLYAIPAFRRIWRLFVQADPVVVISTYSFFNYAVMRAVRRAHRPVGSILLFSDPRTVHSTWLTIRTVDAIFAPTHETRAQALDAGFADEHVHLTGWPVRRQFHTQEALDRADLLRRLQLEPERFTIFLQGGGEGTAKFTRTVEALLALQAGAGTDAAHSFPFQIILAVGTNEMLRERFQRVPGIYPLPFTKEIAPYMAASDLIMGKAGPNMLFESVALGKPFVATTFIPGQEEPNLEFIRRHGLGWVALDVPSQRKLVQSLLADTAKLSAMQASVETYRRWNNEANETILPLTNAVVEKMQTV